MPLSTKERNAWTEILATMDEGFAEDIARGTIGKGLALAVLFSVSATIEHEDPEFAGSLEWPLATSATPPPAPGVAVIAEAAPDAEEMAWDGGTKTLLDAVEEDERRDG